MFTEALMAMKSRNDDRMWRKTTSFYEGNECQGTDPNRNWDTHWGDQNGTVPFIKSEFREAP